MNSLGSGKKLRDETSWSWIVGRKAEGTADEESLQARVVAEIGVPGYLGLGPRSAPRPRAGDLVSLFGGRRGGDVEEGGGWQVKEREGNENAVGRGGRRRTSACDVSMGHASRARGPSIPFSRCRPGHAWPRSRHPCS
jgi:hypothetical protein